MISPQILHFIICCLVWPNSVSPLCAEVTWGFLFTRHIPGPCFPWFSFNMSGRGQEIGMASMPPKDSLLLEPLSNCSEFGVCPLHIRRLPKARDPSDTVINREPSQRVMQSKFNEEVHQRMNKAQLREESIITENYQTLRPPGTLQAVLEKLRWVGEGYKTGSKAVSLSCHQ